MPGYRKTKNVDFKKMVAQSAEEIEYQKNYARRRAGETAKDVSAGRMSPKQGRVQQAAYERVNKGLAPKKPAGGYKGAMRDLGEGIRKITKFGKKLAGGADDLQALPAKMPKKKKGE
jgi:hypothetical protein